MTWHIVSVLVGEFTSEGGSYKYLLSGTSGGFSSTSTNSSAKTYRASLSVVDSPPMNPGNYKFEFVMGNFYVNSTLEFLYYYDLSE
ncbi:MAG: hypothetical protein QXZ17_15205 [Nitrososphaerota archaeon]